MPRSGRNRRGGAAPSLNPFSKKTWPRARGQAGNPLGEILICQQLPSGRALGDLAPCFQAGCRDFIGPFPPSLVIRYSVRRISYRKNTILSRRFLQPQHDIHPADFPGLPFPALRRAGPVLRLSVVQVHDMGGHDFAGDQRVLRKSPSARKPKPGIRTGRQSVSVPPP